MMVEFRNPAYNASGTIDVEINHEVYGWVPFTASPDDPEAHGRDVYAAAATTATPYHPPVISFAEKKAAKLAALADSRWRVEIGGITVGGGAIATDRDSQGLIGNAYQGALRHPATIIQFKGLNGWVTLDAATMIAIGDAVFFHVQACFARESVLAEQIASAADQAALDAIDINSGWPGQ